MFRKSSRSIAVRLLTIFIFSLTAPAAFAGSVSLSWDPTTTHTDGTPVVNLAGYKVYTGTSPGVYALVTDAGLSTSAQVPNLTDGKTYYFTVTSYTSAGMESGYSNEVSKTVPLPVTTQYTLTVSKTGTGSGVVSSSPGTISCGTVCGNTYAAGTAVSLTATPAVNSLFTGWSGACTGTGTCSVTMNSNVSVSANFAVKTFTITPSAGTGGSITPSGAVTVNYGGGAGFTISPATGYKIASVLVNGTSVGAPSSYQFSNVTSNQTIRALFEAAATEPSPEAKLRCADGGIPCVERVDGGSDGDNLVNGKPRADMVYRFKALVDGLPQSAALFMSQRTNPGAGDFARYPMTCSADASGATACAFTTKLGPAAIHTFYLEAKMADGSLLRYPATGTATGPRVSLLNGYSLLGIARDAESAAMDGKTAVGTGATFRLAADGKYVSVKSSSPVRAGEGYYSNTSGTVPEHASLPDVRQSTFTIPLHQGWNIISNPYTANVRLADILVARGSEPPVSWRTAVLNGWIANGLFTYDGKDWGGGYTVESDEVAVLAPWMGYMVSVNSGSALYSLVIPRP